MKKGLRKCIALLLAVLLCCGCAGSAMAARTRSIVSEVDMIKGLNGNINDYVKPELEDRKTRYTVNQEGMTDLIMLSNKIFHDNSNKEQVMDLINNDPSLSNLLVVEKLIFSDVNWPLNISNAEIERINDFRQAFQRTEIQNFGNQILSASIDPLQIISLDVLLNVSCVDFEILLLRKLISCSFPDHWEEIDKPSANISAAERKTTIGKNGEIFNYGALESEYFEYFDPENNENEYYVVGSPILRTAQEKYNLIFQPVVCFIVNGYACVFFNTAYYGQGTAIINGISEIEVYSNDGKINTGGSAKNDFKKPIVLNPGDHTYAALIFDPGTWNDMNWVAEIENVLVNGTPKTNKYKIKLRISNTRWEK